MPGAPGTPLTVRQQWPKAERCRCRVPLLYHDGRAWVYLIGGAVGYCPRVRSAWNVGRRRSYFGPVELDYMKLYSAPSEMEIPTITIG